MSIGRITYVRSIIHSSRAWHARFEVLVPPSPACSELRKDPDEGKTATIPPITLATRLVAV